MLIPVKKLTTDMFYLPNFSKSSKDFTWKHQALLKLHHSFQPKDGDKTNHHCFHKICILNIYLYY